MSTKLSDAQWEKLETTLSKADCKLSMGKLVRFLKKAGVKVLELHKQAIWDSFKTKKYLEEEEESFDDRVVHLQALLNAKISNRWNRIQQLIGLDEEEELEREQL